MIRCMDHVVHRAATARLIMDRIGIGVAIAEFLLKTGSYEFCPGDGLQSAQGLPVIAAPPSIKALRCLGLTPPSISLR
jgi:hypothetical protein